MAYLIRKGTRVNLRKPSGEVVVFTCRRDCLLQKRERVGEHRTIVFKRGEFVLSVSALDVTEISYKCPQCGTVGDVEGLCDACPRQWLPKR